MAKRCPVGTEVQTLLIPISRYSASDARSWAKDHGFKSGKVHTTGEYHRIRQASPGDFEASSFRTITLGKEIRAVIGCPI